MRDPPLSNCEKEFILSAIKERKRLDGREVYDYRRICITFGVDRGCCVVQLGNTRVMAQVSSEVTSPKQTRPTEGMLFVNVELSPMAAPHFEVGRQSDSGVELNRILERCLQESRCLDTESLCIMAGIKVWSIRVDIHVLNHDGNLTDCSSVAAIAALAHFRRPDVTVSGEEVTIHSMEDRDPIPLSVHHMPICVTFAFFEQGQYLLVDPLEKEERVMEGKMVIGMNKHREICTLQMTGSMLLLKDQVLRCSNIAVVKVTEITELIQQALQNDTQARAKGEKFGFAASVETKKVTAAQKQPDAVPQEELLKATEEREDEAQDGKTEEPEMTRASKVTVLARGTACIGEGGQNTWNAEDDEDGDEDEDDAEAEMIIAEQRRMQQQQQQQQRQQQSLEGRIETIELSGESEEEEVTVLGQDDLEMNTAGESAVLSGGIDLSMALKKASKASPAVLLDSSGSKKKRKK